MAGRLNHYLLQTPLSSMPLTDHPLVPTGLLPAPRWLIKDIIPLGHSPSEIFITVLFGPGGTFKTYVLLAWALCIATGRPWFGHKVRQGNVLFVAADDPGGAQPRAQAWAGHFDLAAEAVDQLAERARLIKGAINFFETAEVDTAIADLKRIGFKPTVVFIDTYFHSSQGADVSTSPKDNLKVIGNIRNFAKQVSAA
jgi:RecA-family ATPase